MSDEKTRKSVKLLRIIITKWKGSAESEMKQWEARKWKVNYNAKGNCHRPRAI